MKQSELGVKLYHRLGLKVDDKVRKKINHYLTGYIQLPEKEAEIIADILDIDAGYLLGLDDFTCQSYAMYERKISRNQMISRKTYKLFEVTELFGIGHSSGEVIKNGKLQKRDIEYFTLIRDFGKDMKNFTPEELGRFYQSVIKFMNEYYDSFVETVHTEQPSYIKELPMSEKDITRLSSSIEKIRKATTSKQSRERSEKGKAPDVKQNTTKKGSKCNE